MILKQSAWKGLLAVAFLCVLSAEFYQHIIRKSPQEKITYAQEQYLVLEKRIQKSLEEIITFRTDSQFHQFFMHSGQQESGFSFLFYENGKLKFWSDNETIPGEDFIKSPVADGTVFQLPNGVYSAYEKSNGRRNVIGLILLRKNFSYENKFLENHFNPKLGLDNSFDVNSASNIVIRSGSGSDVLKLYRSNAIPDTVPFTAAGWLFLLGFLFLLAAVFFYFRNRHAGLFTLIILALAFFLVRFLMIYLRLPAELYFTDFFSPKAYGFSFFFNSTGDFLLNSLCIAAFAGIFYHQNKKHVISGKSISRFLLPLGIVIIFLTSFFYVIHKLLGDLVLNSKITFDISIPDWNADTFAAMLAVTLLLWSFYFLACALLLPFRKFLFSVSLLRRMNSLKAGLVALVILSLYASIVINRNVQEKKIESQKLFAQRLEVRQDPLGEYLFEDLQKRMITDTFILKSLLDGLSADQLIRYIQLNYFSGYFTRYDAAITIYDSTGISALGIRSDSLLHAEAEFNSARPTALSPALRLISDDSGKLRYVSLLKIRGESAAATLKILLSSRSTQLPEGFPELLIGTRITSPADESTYSYARYKNGSLIYAGGNYSYAFHPGEFEHGSKEFTSLRFDHYDHLVYRPVPGSIVVVSRPSPGFFDSLSLFSYILLFFLLIFTLAYVLFFLLENAGRFHLSLKQRIRTALISLVIISFVLIAGGTTVYIINKYEADKNKDMLTTLNAMWFAISDRFGFDGPLSELEKAPWTAELNSIVSNFNLDFNLFDENGMLFYSSQPKLFEKGIVSTRMHPEALFEMKEYSKTQFVQSEHIGKLTFAAAYAPFTDRSGNVAGYLNLPYFERQNELNREISGFLSALINIYMLLLVVSLILALIITSRITKPLLLIQEKLSGIRLGSTNEMIEWKRNDEIGQLVNEYNKMVEALADSAEKLSRSERESAWREMAQQVAHEIKNPLTPMKLSVQHLQRAWNEKSGNLDELFQRISKTIIEQIDTLSVIASEFSNFAKMPKAKLEVLELNEMLASAVNLFAVTPGVEIILNKYSEPLPVFADREQLSRGFSNLIKNAIQSIPDNRQGKVEISVYPENGFQSIQIADNGTGIPVHLQPRIFSPNFTTKTSGMGLGLAMVKSAVESIGGSISFQTKEGEGTTFTIKLPVYYNNGALTLS